MIYKFFLRNFWQGRNALAGVRYFLCCNFQNPANNFRYFEIKKNAHIVHSECLVTQIVVHSEWLGIHILSNQNG